MESLALTERPEPKPRCGEVLLRMRAAALNYRDLLVPLRGYGAMTGTLPLIPVSDGVGEIVALGPGVTRVATGNRDGFEAMNRAIAQHRVEPLVDRVFAFEELRGALGYLAAGSHCGKICLRHPD